MSSALKPSRLDEQYPAIEARAKTEGAEIHWGDETALVNTDIRGRRYAPVGKTPVTFVVGGTRHKLYPNYSPELNPEERLNADLKYVITSKVPERTKAKLSAAATDHMTMLEQNSERVCRYFGDPKVAYVAP